MRLGLVFAPRKREIPFLRYIMIFMLVSLLVFVGITFKIAPMIISVAKGYAVNAVSNRLNEIIDNAMKDNDYSFIDVITDSDGSVSAVKMNGTDTNLLRTEIAIGLKNAIDAMDEIEASIPLGNFLPHPFFSGMGPDVPVKFLILANTEVNARESFKDKGINQVLYTVTFHVVTDVGIYIPAMKSSVRVENDIPVSQMVIVGKVPETYTNVEGLEGTIQDAIMNLD